MRPKALYVLSILLAFVLAISLPAYGAFDSGSTGADGAFNPGANTTLQVPDSGIFNFTTVDIPSGVTVTFALNTTNSPVTILATGDVTISGIIDVTGSAAASGGGSGLGGPGGYKGGSGSDQVGVLGGRGLGPGGGEGGNDLSYGGGGGSFGTPGGAHSGPTYGNSILLPLIGGSGGGGGGANGNPDLGSILGGGGGGGGGAIVIASSGLITVGGTIQSDGGAGGPTGGTGSGGGGGSGGAIRLIANTVTVTSSGRFFARGASGGVGHFSVNGSVGGNGRVRLEGFTVTIPGGTGIPSPTTGLPSVVSLPDPPSLRITTVAGVAAPATPTGGSGGIDITLPPQGGPTTIEVAGSKIPVGTSVRVLVAPETGNAADANGLLSGTNESSTTSVNITLPDGLSFITATATFSTTTAALDAPIMIGGEFVEHVRVASVLGGKSSVYLITESGKEIPWR